MDDRRGPDGQGAGGQGWRPAPGLRLRGADRAAMACRVAEEVPVGLRYNGMPHVVVMATPLDLDDLAVGFSLTDGVCEPGDVGAIGRRDADGAIDLDVRLPAAAFERFLRDRQRRNTRAHTSCGICGIESVDGLPSVRAKVAAVAVDTAAVRRALQELPPFQTLHAATGAAHAAAWADREGRIALVREDVGRHNALDKLIGARARAGAIDPGGFCVVTSRCSFEMVQKAVAAGMGLLVCISAPTSLAIAQAEAAGLTLIALARGDSQTVYAGPGMSLNAF